VTVLWVEQCEGEGASSLGVGCLFVHVGVSFLLILVKKMKKEKKGKQCGVCLYILSVDPFSPYKPISLYCFTIDNTTKCLNKQKNESTFLLSHNSSILPFRLEKQK